MPPSTQSLPAQIQSLLRHHPYIRVESDGCKSHSGSDWGIVPGSHAPLYHSSQSHQQSHHRHSKAPFCRWSSTSGGLPPVNKSTNTSQPKDLSPKLKMRRRYSGDDDKNSTPPELRHQDSPTSVRDFLFQGPDSFPLALVDQCTDVML